MWCRKCSNFIGLHVAVQLSQECLLKWLSFLFCMFLPLLAMIHRLDVQVFSWALFHWPICVFLCQYHTVLSTQLCSIVWNLPVLWLLLCGFSSELVWKFRVLGSSIWIVELFVVVLWKNDIVFLVCFLKIIHFVFFYLCHILCGMSLIHLAGLGSNQGLCSKLRYGILNLLWHSKDALP